MAGGRPPPTPLPLRRQSGRAPPPIPPCTNPRLLEYPSLLGGVDVLEPRSRETRGRRRRRAGGLPQGQLDSHESWPHGDRPWRNWRSSRDRASCHFEGRFSFKLRIDKVYKQTERISFGVCLATLTPHSRDDHTDAVEGSTSLACMRQQGGARRGGLAGRGARG